MAIKMSGWSIERLAQYDMLSRIYDRGALNGSYESLRPFIGGVPNMIYSMSYGNCLRAGIPGVYIMGHHRVYISKFYNVRSWRDEFHMRLGGFVTNMEDDYFINDLKADMFTTYQPQYRNIQFDGKSILFHDGSWSASTGDPILMAEIQGSKKLVFPENGVDDDDTR